MKCFKCNTPIVKKDLRYKYEYDDNCYLYICAGCHNLTRRKYKTITKPNNKRLFGYGSDTEAIIVKLVFMLRHHPDKRHGPKKIADILYDEGFRNSKGNKIVANQIQRILEREELYKKEGFI